MSYQHNSRQNKSNKSNQKYNGIIGKNYMLHMLNNKINSPILELQSINQVDRKDNIIQRIFVNHIKCNQIKSNTNIKLYPTKINSFAQIQKKPIRKQIIRQKDVFTNQKVKKNDIPKFINIKYVNKESQSKRVRTQNLTNQKTTNIISSNHQSRKHEDQIQDHPILNQVKKIIKNESTSIKPRSKTFSAKYNAYSMLDQPFERFKQNGCQGIQFSNCIFFAQQFPPKKSWF